MSINLPGTTFNGGYNSTLNLIGVGTIKASFGALARISVISPGTAGTLTINDCVTIGTATAANEFYSVPFGSLSAGQIITLEWPCSVGIQVSSMPTGAVIALSWF